MKKCPDCKCECGDDAKFCEECGYKFPQTKQCPKCHAELKLTAKFCMECGYSFQGQQDGGGKPFLGDNNMVSGDVVGGNLDRRTYNGNVTTNNTSNVTTTNNVTNNTTSIVNNNIDESRKMVQCHICGDNMTIEKSYTCRSCGKYVCEKCRDAVTGLCRNCLEESAEGEARKLYTKAETLRITRKYAEAMELYGGILTLENLSRELKAKVNNAIGFVLSSCNSDNYKKINNLLRDNPNEECLAMCEQGIGRAKEAIEYYQKATELNPAEKNYKTNLLTETRNLDAFCELKETLEKKLSPEGRAEVEARSLRAQGDALLAARRFDEATELYRKILSLTSLSSDLKANVFNDLAVTLARKNQVLYDTLSKQLRDNPKKDHETSIQELIGRQQDIVEYYRKAITLTTDNKTFVGNLEAAEKNLNVYLDMGKRHLLSQMNQICARADSCCASRQYTEAVGMYMEILAKDNLPDAFAAEVNNKLGMALHNSNSVQPFQKQLQNFDENSYVLICQLVEREQKAIGYLKKAVEFKNNNYSFTHSLEGAVEVLNGMMKLKQAIESKLPASVILKIRAHGNTRQEEPEITENVEAATAYLAEIPSVELTEAIPDKSLYRLPGGRLECSCGCNEFKGTACLFSYVSPEGKVTGLTLLHNLSCGKCGRHVLFDDPIFEDGEKPRLLFAPDDKIEAVRSICEAFGNPEEDDYAWDISRGFVIDLDRKLLIGSLWLPAYLNAALRAKGAVFYTILEMPHVVFNISQGSFTPVDFGTLGKIATTNDYVAIVLQKYNAFNAEEKKDMCTADSDKPMLKKNGLGLVCVSRSAYSVDNDGAMKQESVSGNDQETIAAFEKYLHLDSEEEEEEMKVCPKCGAERLEGKKFCTKCGFKFPEDEIEVEDEEEDEDLEEDEEDEMECCPKCGAERKDGKKFCTKCGYRFPD